MLDYTRARKSSVAFWESQPTDQPHTLNGFNGTWAFSDHSLIPDALRNFLGEYFYKEVADTRRNQLNRIPLDKINSCLNDIWAGPGSMATIVNATYDLKQNRMLETPDNAKDALKGYETPTIESNLDQGFDKPTVDTDK